MSPRPQRPCARHALTRRQFLQATAITAAGATAASLGVAAAAGAAVPPAVPVGPGQRVALVGVPRGADATAVAAAVRDAATAATDFSWLAPGDRVLLKVMCNSPNPYPATTHPGAVTAMAELLRQRGARVWVGDQSGVQFVHHTRDSQRGSTRANFKNNGLEQAALAGGAEVACFEEAGYDGYFAAQPASGSHFRDEIYLPQLVREVDHIVYLPRVSKHVLAGSTLGLKGAVGWLRQDSRHELHRAGASFLEKCADINGAKEIRERLRLALTVGTQVQTSFGPDTGHIATPDVGLVLASESLVAHDIASCAYLLEVSEGSTPWAARTFDPYPQLASMINRTFVSYVWGAGQFTEVSGYDAPRLVSPWSCKVLARGCEIFGGRPGELELQNVSDTVPGGLLEAVAQRAAFPG